MDGPGRKARGFGHLLGGPAGGGRQQNLDVKLGVNLEHRLDDGGFSGAGPAGDDHELGLDRGDNGFFLVFRERKV